MKVEFREDEIVFSNYPYPPSRLYPNGVLKPHQVMEVNPKGMPPTILTGWNEFVMVPALQHDDLVAFANRHELPHEQRADVWHLLLEPFLERELSMSRQRQLMQELENCGLDSDAVLDLRDEVGEAIIALNNVYQEDFHLGLFDALDAMKMSLPASEFKKFFRKCMRFARYG